jgi:predicted RNase H-like HicB family nuclease
MKLPPLTVVVEKDEDWYVATCPEFGVASQGHSIEEAEAMIEEAGELLLEEASPEEIGRRLNCWVEEPLSNSSRSLQP